MLERSLEVPFFERVKHHLRLTIDLLYGIKMFTLQVGGWVESDDHFGAAEKLVRFYAI